MAWAQVLCIHGLLKKLLLRFNLQCKELSRALKKGGSFLVNHTLFEKKGKLVFNRECPTALKPLVAGTTSFL